MTLRPGLRQLKIGELDAAWNFVTGQRSTAVRDRFVHTERDSGLQHDTRHDQLAPLGIRYAEHRSFANGRVFLAKPRMTLAPRATTPGCPTPISDPDSSTTRTSIIGGHERFSA
jgi:hypothetical protein